LTFWPPGPEAVTKSNCNSASSIARLGVDAQHAMRFLRPKGVAPRPAARPADRKSGTLPRLNSRPTWRAGVNEKARVFGAARRSTPGALKNGMSAIPVEEPAVCAQKATPPCSAEVMAPLHHLEDEPEAEHQDRRSLTKRTKMKTDHQHGPRSRADAARN